MQNMNLKTICAGYHITAQFNTFHEVMRQPYMVLNQAGHVLQGAYVPGQTIVIGGVDEIENLAKNMLAFAAEMRRINQTQPGRVISLNQEGENEQ
jgi:hypothetical protein